MKLNAYEAIVLLHPKEYGPSVVLGPGDEENTKLILDIKTILAADQERARSSAAAKIPVEYHDRLERVEVLVRPF